ncbi:hypothetical protein TNCV_1762731 [Trichonephila clavipes]|nr:hypothetical protein TNCV_1762731 [Trichonephila clavipes]
MEVNKEKTRYILQFFFDKGENASQVAEIVNDVYGAVTVTANNVHRNEEKITGIIEVDRHGYSKHPSSRKSSIDFGGKEKSSDALDFHQGVLPLNWEWNQAKKTYCHLFGAQGYDKRQAYT